MSGREHKRPELTGWQIHLGGMPVAVRSAEPAWQGQDSILLHDLAGGVAYGFDAIRAFWEQAHEQAKITGYRIRLQSAPGGQAMTVGQATISDHVVEADLLVNPQAFAEIADADIQAAHALMGESVGDIARRGGVADESAAAISQTWAQLVI